MSNKPTKAEKQSEKLRCVAMLKKWIKPGDTVWTIFKSCSASGMTRRYEFFIIGKHERKHIPLRISYYIAKALEYNLSDNGVAAYDDFQVVYNLGRVLFPKGFIPAKCGRHGRNGTPTTERDNDGGYALIQQRLC